MKYYSQPRIAVLGGGTGLSTMLRGLKAHTPHITAIVTVSDDGGSSGILRRELGMLPPGDIRNCILALSNREPLMQEVLNYRFREGSLSGQSLGNLVLAALNDMTGSFDQAVSLLGQVLAITGTVLPVTNENIVLQAEFEDGSHIRGETHITDYKKHTESVIRRISLDPPEPPALPEALEAIREADMIIFGPGSLYTSVIPNLLTQGVADAVRACPGVKVYVMNVMTQDGETENYTAADHVRALQDHGGKALFQYVLVNNQPIPSELLEAYRRENAVPVPVDANDLRALGTEPVFAPVARWRDGLIRHDPAALSESLMKLYLANAATRKAK